MKIVSRKIIIFIIIAFITAALLLLGAWGISATNLLNKSNNDPAAKTPIIDSIPKDASDGYYRIINSGNEGIIFSNQVDGYGVLLPDTMRVTETRLADYRMALEDDLRRLEIYKQPISPKEDFSAETYVTYSNGFLQNTVDHKLEFQQKTKVNGYKVVITQWSRNKALNIENDKNHYACIDIITKDNVYTFLIKSQTRLEDSSDYDYKKLVESFYSFAPTATPASIKLSQTETKAWNAETVAFYDKYFKEGQLTWGIFYNSAPKDMSELKVIEAAIDYKFKFLLIYKHIQEVFPVGYVRNDLEAAYSDDKIVELTLQTPTLDEGEANMVYDILDGKYDHFLYAFAKETAQFGHPVLFRFCNEMNGDWCSYSAYHTSRDPEMFKELYKYVYKIFNDVNADNVIWVWNPNERSFPDFKWNNELLYYPGDAYVDVIGLTGYNTGTYYKDEVWRSFSKIYDPIYEKFAHISEKPLMITEFSSSSVGGNKAEWINDMFLSFNKYPRINVAIWWHGCDLDSRGNVARPYFINESTDLLDVFKEHLKKYAQIKELIH
ncbi:MAG: glycosyl hydrolase [Eubacteriales bacterium]|nr:glycosyl hydrolase [Eubacteriales bacterium]